MINILFLGTGAAEGIPAIQCDCHHCRMAREKGGKLIRERSSILFSLPDYKLLVDAPPNVKHMLTVNHIREIDGIFISHSHFDHSGGLEEFAYWHRELDLFTDESFYRKMVQNGRVEGLRRVMFNTLFHQGMAFRFDDFFMVPFAVRHPVPCYGLAIFQGKNKVIYTSDTSSRFSNYARCLMLGADLLIVNTPEFSKATKDHITVTEAVELKDKVKARHLILTHFNHNNKTHDELEDFIKDKKGISIAYDGFQIQI